MSKPAPVPAACPPRYQVHGTLGSYNVGCRCAACQGAYDAHAGVASPPPSTSKPVATGKRRAGRGWIVKIREVGDTAVERDGTHHFITHDEIVCWWNGANGIVACTQQTWDLIEADDGAITAMQEAQEEAKHKTPKAVVRNVRVAGALNPPPVPTGRKPKASHGIKELKAQAIALVEEMTRFPHPSPVQQAEFARRYGALRDRMAVLRRDFTETEGVFETAQNQLVAFMED